MMRLKDLIRDTNPAATMAIERWDHQPGSLKFWRASANYIYRFEHAGSGRFMRMTHFEEKGLDQVQAEIEFLQYLAANDYPCVRPVASKAGNLIEILEVDSVTYYTVVFNAALGKILEFDEMTDRQAFTWGQSLARLHRLSMEYRLLHHTRWTWRDWLMRTSTFLDTLPEEAAAHEELDRVHNFLESLPVTATNYGLIHYDFQQDNVLWDEASQDFEVIDFDDSQYHFYAMDLAAALEDVSGTARESMILDNFQSGYRSVVSPGGYAPGTGSTAVGGPDDDTAAGGPGEGYGGLTQLLPGLRRYSDLIRFGRIMRALQDSDFPEDPPWLQRVRPRLVNRCDRLREGFGRPW